MAEYEFEWDKYIKGQYIVKQSRKWLTKNGNKDNDIQLLSLEREVTGKIVRYGRDPVLLKQLARASRPSSAPT